MIQKIIILIILIIAISSCASGPDYAKPEFHVSDWIEPSSQESIKARWWESFNDPTLNALIEKVLKTNLDIKEATARVRESRALRVSANSLLTPRIDFGADYVSNQASLNEAGAAPTFIENGLVDRRIDYYDVGFDSTWEIDIFGGNRHRVEAASARLEASIASRRDVVLSVLAETARNYIELRGTQKRLKILKKNIEIQNETRQIIKKKYDSGLAREVEFLRAEAQYANSRALLPNVESAIRALSYQVAVLTGQQPVNVYQEFLKVDSEPRPDRIISLGIKSDILRRRPDIQLAERELAASTADIGVAVAELYPSFNLNASFGYIAADSAGDLFKNSSEALLITPFIRLPIFNGGDLRSKIKVAEARESQAAINYEIIVLNALKEAETSIVNFAKEQEKQIRLEEAVHSLQNSLVLTKTLYNTGLTDFINVLEVERDLTSTEDNLVRSETMTLTNLVRLYKSLGGGWEVFEKQSQT